MALTGETYMMDDTPRTRRRVLQTTGVAIGSTLAMGAASAHEGEISQTYSADLSGETVLRDVDTDASGTATFEVDRDAEAIHYAIDVAHLCNATRACIHCGAEGEEGPVIAVLHPTDGSDERLIEGRFDGTLAEGTLTVDDLVGPLEGADLETAGRKLAEAGAYVEIHTETYPEGELRGRITADGDWDAQATGEDDETEKEPEDEEPTDDDQAADTDEEPVSSAADAQGMLEVTDMAVGGDDPENEWIELTNVGDVAVDMSGWTVRDREEHGRVAEGWDPAAFPSGFTLESGASVRLVTAEGQHTDETVYWGYDSQMWNEDGDVIIVLDAEGESVLEHEYGEPPVPMITALFNRLSAAFA